MSPVRDFITGLLMVLVAFCFYTVHDLRKEIRTTRWKNIGTIKYTNDNLEKIVNNEKNIKKNTKRINTVLSHQIEMSQAIKDNNDNIGNLYDCTNVMGKNVLRMSEILGGDK